MKNPGTVRQAAKNEEVRLLSDLASTLLLSEEPREVLDDVFGKLSAYLGLETFFNYLVTDDGSRLRLYNYAGIPDQTAREIEWLEYGQAICGCAARDRRPIVAENVQRSADPRADLIRSLGITAYCCHPLIAHGRLIGTLSFGTRDRTRFADGEVRLMRAACNLVAVSLERAALITDLKDGNAELEAKVQERTIEIQEKQEELKVQAEELETRTDELLANNEELKLRIEEKERAEEALRESERNLAMAQEIAHLGSWIWDIPRDRQTWSDERYRTFGLAPGEATPTFGLYMNFVHPDDREHVKTTLAEALSRKGAFSIAYRIIRKDGFLRYMQSKGHVTFDATGRPLKMFAISQDVTERRLAERENEITVEFLKIVNEARSTGELVRATGAFFRRESGCEVLGIRLKQGEDYPYYVTHGFTEEFLAMENHLCTRTEGGMTLYGQDGRPVYECVCGNVVCGRYNALMPFYTGKGTFWTNSTSRLVENYTDRDLMAHIRGRCVENFESVAVIRIGLGGETLGLLHINDRRRGMFSPETIALWERLADQLAVALAKFRADEELKEAKHQAELYLDLMGHDISNMHQIILGQLQLAEEIMGADGKLEGADKDLISTSIRNLLKSARLIENVRNLQKFRAGEYSLEPVDLGAALNDALATFAHVPGRDVSIDYRPAQGCVARVNPLIKEVFGNLVDNAVKHSYDPVRIGVTLSQVERKGRRYHRVAIEDNGPGIPDDRKAEVFDRMKRGQTKARGTGLGLYIVRTLVESFDGVVEVEDRVAGDHRQGSRFLVYLPAIREENNGK